MNPLRVQREDGVGLGWGGWVDGWGVEGAWGAWGREPAAGQGRRGGVWGGAGPAGRGPGGRGKDERGSSPTSSTIAE